jgi:agmatinase
VDQLRHRRARSGACAEHGTPVPGGLGWGEVAFWLDELVASGRRVVGLDLNEVNPGPDWDPEGDAPDTWDAIVGARLL